MYIEEKKTHLQSTEYFIDGTVAEVSARIEQLYRVYPPQAYGTFVYRTEFYDNARRMKTEVRRSNSAD
jgi:hypothetical protein